MENYKLNKYIDYLFLNQENSEEIREFKEELYSNSNDRYRDYLEKGFDEESAYAKTIYSIGDINEALKVYSDKEYTKEKSKTNDVEDFIKNKKELIKHRALGISLLIISPGIPSFISYDFKNIGIAMFFVLIGLGVSLILYGQINRKNYKEYNISNCDEEKLNDIVKKNSFMKAVAIFLFIFSVVPVVALKNIGVIFMFLLIAIGVYMLIFQLSLYRPIVKNNKLSSFYDENITRDVKKKISTGIILSIFIYIISPISTVLLIGNIGAAIFLTMIALATFLMIYFISIKKGIFGEKKYDMVASVEK